MLLLLLLLRGSNAFVIACVGDSITFGTATSDRSVASYPARLKSMFLNGESSITVRNFGVSGAAVTRGSNKPYWDLPMYAEALASTPDVVIVMLGTNDAQFQNGFDESTFTADYLALIQSFRSIGEPAIWVAIPPPMYDSNDGWVDYSWGTNATVINTLLPRIVPEIASLANVSGVIDLFAEMGGRQGLFCNYQSCDTIHPNDAGNVFMASKVFSALFYVGSTLKDLPANDGSSSASSSCSSSLLEKRRLNRREWVIAVTAALLSSFLAVFFFFALPRPIAMIARRRSAKAAKRVEPSEEIIQDPQKKEIITPVDAPASEAKSSQVRSRPID